MNLHARLPSRSHVPCCTSGLLLHPRGETQDSPSLSPHPLLSGDRMKLGGGATKAAQRHPKPEPRSTEILQLKKKIFCRDFQNIPVFWVHSYTQVLLDLIFHREPSQKKRHMFRLVPSCRLYPAEAGCAPWVPLHPCCPDSIILQWELPSCHGPHMATLSSSSSQACDFRCTESYSLNTLF